MRKYHQYTVKHIRYIKEAYTRESYSIKDLTSDFNALFNTQLTTGKIKGVVKYVDAS
jgi:hypothetical protein